MTAPWPALTPEAAHTLLAGPTCPGEESTVAAGGAWQSQTIESLTHAGMSEANTAATGPGWIGLGGAASAESATTMNGTLSALSGWCEAKVPIAATAALAYRTAVSAMFPAPVCTENRVEQGKDVAINPLVWGALTPDIVRLDTTYFGVYWTTNASAGVTYSTVLTGFLTTLGIPPPVGPPSVSPAAPAAAAEEVASATADSAANQGLTSAAQGTVDAGSQVGSAPLGSADMMEPVMSAAQAPMSAVQSLTSPVESGMQAFTAPLSQFTGMFSQFGQGAGGAAAVPTDAVMPATSATQVASTVGSAGASGAGFSGSGVSAATGLTSYTRPTSSFAPETAAVSGTASYAKPGAIRPGGAASVPVTGGGTPMAPLGMMRPGGEGKGKDGETKTAKLSA